ncbi:aminotransferase class I/II-fold pyridoxal phosphate-dependent enzyme [Cellulomonas sp. ACRRI]|uniref:MalY/PatB family protein n=1 Tax=Cellulomonas sp. ACRRI TaxID=2918188 RepID=UPI001EF36322|nr:aminotransferase class I/II-fold pyridoxal phosphate-dependent enzyme [Cellulomonas sp. ACRRI]MCG7284874.1 aminotransferase class I/II-fold pyridoxal phosphate-dependent enzyme [Cellulomonas sp. ACRRI]
MTDLLPPPGRTRTWQEHADVLRRRGGEKWAAATPDQLAAWVAEMDFGAAPAVTDALHDLVARAELGYVAPARRQTYREAVARWYADEHGYVVDPARVHVVADVIEAYRQALAHLFPEGDVVLPVPAYPPFTIAARTLGRRVRTVLLRERAGRWELDLDALDAALRGGPHVLVLCNPQNPTGRVHTRTELLAVADLAERHGARVFADEIHAPLVHAGHVHVPYASVSPGAAAHSVTAFSPSKAFNLASLKSAALLLTRDEDVRALADVGHLASHGASIAGLVAGTAALDAARPWLADVRATLQHNRDRVLATLSGAPGLRLAAPEGTYLAWVDATATGVTTPAAHLADRGVLVNDGAGFGDAYGSWFRLNFATPAPVLEEIVRRVVAAFT